MKDNIVYKVALEFSQFPGGRKQQNGPFSGEEFYVTVTKPLLEKYQKVEFDLSGSKGYSSGFLDEAFGEIGRWIGYTAARDRVTLVAVDDALAVETAWKRIKEASKEAGKQ